MHGKKPGPWPAVAGGIVGGAGSAALIVTGVLASGGWETWLAAPVIVAAGAFAGSIFSTSDGRKPTGPTDTTHF